MIDPVGLQRALAGGRRLVVFLHDNPDPDAFWAGWILAHIAESCGLKTKKVHGESLGRAEKSAMVRLLGMCLERFAPEKFNPKGSDRFALLDTQTPSGQQFVS